MNPDDLVRTLNENGFFARIVCGYYDAPDNNAKYLIKSTANRFISLMGKKGLMLAPYFAIAGNK
jgi:hypothetical protein